jgi:hypothetical protein
MTAPAADSSNEVVFTLNATIKFGDDHVGTMEVRLVYTGGSGTACTYTLGATSASAPAAGGAFTVAGTAAPAGCAWTAVSNASWIAATSGTGTVSYTVSANPSASSRTGTITIAGQTFTVTQAGAAAATCTYTLSPASASAPAAGGAFTVAVSASAGACAWSAAPNDLWITLTGWTSGVGNGAVAYAVTANSSTSSRTGTITIAGQTFTVTQAGAAAPSPQVLFSDSFRRADAGPCALGRADLALGGSGEWYYIPMFPSAQGPIGAQIRNNWLEHIGMDFGGVQIAPSPGGCSLSTRGLDIGQDRNISVELMVPATPGRTAQAGMYFRSRASAPGDGNLGGEAGGYWVQLWSTGAVKVKRLSPQAFVATSDPPAGFDPNAAHTLQVAFQGSSLQVALDGKLLRFEGGATTVSIPATAGINAGTAGIMFGAEENRGLAGGQKARNLIVTGYSPLSGLPVQ